MSVEAALGPLKAAHRRTLREAGVSALHVKQAVAAGRVRAIRRDWIAAIDCNPALERALQVGAALGCVSAAAVHGIWEFTTPGLHVSAGRHASRLVFEPPSWARDRRPLRIQFDGFGPHSGRAQRTKDLREDERLVRRGYIVLRYGSDQVEYDWPTVESTVLSLIAQGRHLW
ncbi:hypothetical protein [Agromyces italicus]|uniref:hypothetical protein n=1 Tax=Agromyces italicus TaxID=279572 RepID=UPI000413991D|nr:hypothetical protein [Agromyces italicus]